MSSEITPAAAKNALLPLCAIPAAVPGRQEFRGVDCLYTDVEVQLHILRQFGAVTCYDSDSRVLTIDSRGMCFARDELHRISPPTATRGMTQFMGGLLNQDGTVVYGVPGGCDLGARALNYHFDIFQSLGATVDVTDAEEIRIFSGSVEDRGDMEYEFPTISVGGTINGVLASLTGRPGTRCVFRNVAVDPYVTDVIRLLSGMGYDIRMDASRRTIEVRRVLVRGDVTITHDVMTDPIVIGTHIVFNLVLGKSHGIVIPSLGDMGSFMDALYDTGVRWSVDGNVYTFRIERERVPTEITVETREFPGFYTDLQPLFVCLCNSLGVRVTVRENVMTNRFGYLSELEKFGYRVEYPSPKEVTLVGFSGLRPVPDDTTFTLTDLRGGIVIWLECMRRSVAENRIKRPEMIRRGYNVREFETLYLNRAPGMSQ